MIASINGYENNGWIFADVINYFSGLFPSDRQTLKKNFFH